MRRKKPWLAAILNLVLPGTGYIYNGHRKAFGLILLIGIVISVSADLYYNLNPPPMSIYQWVGGSLIFIGFGFDAYNEAKFLNKKK